ncbi:type II secretion system protein GspM [Bradyrhizobium sp. sBnM-33]|uniref:type II secretion system protein GspM n=1 Tax=Bradyrhizobium sp. sBnM-33 TaxID=2831780 RepID=UPI001BD0AE60|nr:type II secretion system protein GspM [Bradyrhizobium sp. sBnM-33]WOH53708.1 type II secretion system protein GspM [Bradyrhizobium sp. sBnM-33]
MIAAIPEKMPRRAAFLAFNIVLVLFIVMFLLAPVLTHFVSRSEEISESAAQLAHFRKIMRSASTPANKSSQDGDPFLAGTEERIVSADLQASLKAIATNAGVNLLAIRGLQGSRSQQLRMVAVSVELEGSMSALRNMVVAIENQTPFLFVAAASVRSVSEGDDGPIRAELKVQGAMRDRGPSGATEAGSK